MKIIRIFIAFVVVSLVVGLGSAFNGKPVKELDTIKTNQIEHEEQKEVKNDTQIEEKEEITAWEELGMTEDEYYNKPAWSWARVDFPVEKYGSEEACFNACIKYGEESEMEFSCSTINSASGRYLGEMIKLF